MKTKVTALIICILLLIGICGCAKKADNQPILISNTYVALSNQSGKQLDVFDISKGVIDQTSLVWSYELENNGVSDIKLRNSKEHGMVAIMSTGGNYGCMVTYPEGKLVWSTKQAADNPHAIELMPNGYIAIASSSGNEVRIFDTKSTSYSEDFADYIDLFDAHGVIWDDTRKLLWAIGRDKLIACSFEVSDGILFSSQEKSFDLPTKSGHDLTLDLSHDDTLLFTTGQGVYSFNIETEEFTELFTDIQNITRTGIKGIGSFSDGSMIYIRPDGGYKQWTSKTLSLVQNGTVTDMLSPIGDYYKCRVWTDRYR